ncbi:TetR family transcriptional regulator [Intrasporangium oryzae NRRL B-24470]|uniref:TetR family transcriptional regulator n=1 Tax=Intrasporangium oryzae NRRL B-24470 TaxID=1386089 RepID=W9G7G7_9MICO|nr:TetR/AcrR family transcriptional regulator [Intrasporangium oryzae]EWT01222.1 TetR family transcriptional regulator [Intrasporangium oryzae NRRL B-24470]
MSSSAVSDPDRSSAPRATYHHGDLRRALLEASLELAREGGPDAVVLREATRRVGVSANAAYRHFADRDALLSATASLAQARGADVISATMADVSRGTTHDARSLARARFRAVGVGYLRFAMNEPGLFRTAFAVPTDLRRSAAPEAAGECGRTPFQLLSDTLDEMLEAGVLPASERPGAELLAWSAVHGLAMLALEGPLRELPPTFVDELAPRLVRMVDLGLGVLSGGDEPGPEGGPVTQPSLDATAPGPGERTHREAGVG